MHCKWRKQELKESLYFIEVKVVAGHVIHSLCLSSWSELFTFQVLKRHFRSKKRIPAKKGGLFVALSEAKQHIYTKYRKNTADYPLSGGIQVCINIIRLVAPISLFYERKLHHCVRIFESITYVTGLKGLVRTVEYLYNTFPYFQVLLLTFDIDEPWSSSVVFILIIFTMCPKSLSAFLSWTISENFLFDNKFCEKR